VAKIPGLADVHVHNQPTARDYAADLTAPRRRKLGLTETDVANSVLVSLSLDHPWVAQSWSARQNHG